MSTVLFYCYKSNEEYFSLYALVKNPHDDKQAIMIERYERDISIIVSHIIKRIISVNILLNHLKYKYIFRYIVTTTDSNKHYFSAFNT